jgi:hypothetical protein
VLSLSSSRQICTGRPEASRQPALWNSAEKPNFVTDSRWAALCVILREDILDLFTEDYDDGPGGHSTSNSLSSLCWSSPLRRLQSLIDADTHAQRNAVPQSCRLQCSLKACDRRPVEHDFMVNMKLNYNHVQFLLRLALLGPGSMDPDPQLLNVSMDMLSLVVGTVILKDQIINSGTSLVWKVSQESRPLN